MLSPDNFIVRVAELDDVPSIAEMFHSLWPSASAEEHAPEIASVLKARGERSSDEILLAADAQGRLLGFVEVNLRSHADGCDPKQPVAYIEGWYVVPEFRRRRVGALLIAAAEDWGRGRGCIEMASDTWLDNLNSQSAHEALGFEIVDRCVHYRKSL
jgi:aminoglycoside 6'-N-acetyltransferase I